MYYVLHCRSLAFRNTFRQSARMREVRSIRLSDEEVESLKRKANTDNLSKAVQIASASLRQQRVPKSESEKHIRKNFGDVLTALADDSLPDPK
jgi:hypothetical protein